jgi:hypothetical protein
MDEIKAIVTAIVLDESITNKERSHKLANILSALVEACEEKDVSFEACSILWNTMMLQIVEEHQDKLGRKH